MGDHRFTSLWGASCIRNAPIDTGSAPSCIYFDTRSAPTRSAPIDTRSAPTRSAPSCIYVYIYICCIFFSFVFTHTMSDTFALWLLRHSSCNLCSLDPFIHHLLAHRVIMVKANKVTSKALCKTAAKKPETNQFLSATACGFRNLLKYRMSDACKKALIVYKTYSGICLLIKIRLFRRTSWHCIACIYIYTYIYEFTSNHSLEFLPPQELQMIMCFMILDLYKATPEEKKEAHEALSKYDMLTDDESRKRFLCLYTR